MRCKSRFAGEQQVQTHTANEELGLARIVFFSGASTVTVSGSPSSVDVETEGASRVITR